VDRAESTLASFSARIVQRHIGHITDNISRSLHALLRKEGLVSRIAIEPGTLEISLFGEATNNLIPPTLCGERQMLATAVLWGLSLSTGRTLPTVITHLLDAR